MPDGTNRRRPAPKGPKPPGHAKPGKPKPDDPQPGRKPKDRKPDDRKPDIDIREPAGPAPDPRIPDRRVPDQPVPGRPPVTRFPDRRLLPGRGVLTPDLGDILVDPTTTVVDRPTPAELPDLLRDRIGKLKLPPPVTGTKPGVVTGPLAVTAKELTALLRGATAGGKVVWSYGGNEVLVHLDGITATVTDGAVVVVVPLESDQTQRVDLPVVFALGSKERETGLLAATPARPPGPAALVDRWGEAVQALAWDALLQVAVALAARAGTDARGDPLVPISLRATPEGLLVAPQGRHRGLR